MAGLLDVLPLVPLITVWHLRMAPFAVLLFSMSPLGPVGLVVSVGPVFRLFPLEQW